MRAIVPDLAFSVENVAKVMKTRLFPFTDKLFCMEYFSSFLIYQEYEIKYIFLLADTNE